ncbi:MAG: MoaD/ThiS family protein [Dehalococcoidia bacterium]
MPTLHVPAPLRSFSDGRESFELEGGTLRAVFAALEDECPTLFGRLVEDGDLRRDIAVAIDGSILEDTGLAQPVAASAEIYLVPPIGGGCEDFEA